MEITSEMLEQASKEETALINENTSVVSAQKQYLETRVLMLRALVNEQQKIINELQGGSESTEEVDNDEAV